MGLMLEIKTSEIKTDFIAEESTVGSEKSIKLLLLLDYLHYKYGLAYNDVFSAAPKEEKIKENTISTTKKNPPYTLKPNEYYEACQYAYLFLIYSARNYSRLRSLDDYILPLVVEVLPQLKDVLQIVDRDDEGLIMQVAESDPESLQAVYNKFKDGAYIIRYASNLDANPEKDNLKEEKPKLAKGKLTVSHELKYKHLKFNIYFDPGEGEKVNLEGRIYILQNYLIFVGKEEEVHNAFFMILDRRLVNDIHGGLTLKKHHKRDYFASRVVVWRKTDMTTCNDVMIGKLPKEELDIHLPRMRSVAEEMLANLTASDEGQSVLYKKSF